MESAFVNEFCDPFDKSQLIFVPFENKGSNQVGGIFINEKTGSAYPLYEGVPVFLIKSFPKQYLEKYSDKIKELKLKYPNLLIGQQEDEYWSFSAEWDEHTDKEMDTTWGLTTESRYQQGLLELQIRESDLKGKKFLDAGCGNGLLTEYFSTKGVQAVGLDFSTSVFAAERRRKATNVCFVRGDLRNCPFQKEAFDFIYSNGVIHHTGNTETTFYRLAEHVKQKGKIFVWLYSRKGSFLWQSKRLFFDFSRMIVCRLPRFLQTLLVNVFTGILFSVYFLLGKRLIWQTLKIDMYDSITPRWRYYHTPEEISKWFFNAGFGPVIVTNWDTKYGFGALGIKEPMSKTPGIHFNFSN